MEWILIILIFLSLATALSIVRMSIPRDVYEPQQLRLSTVLFAGWLVASALLGPFFYIFRPIGFFDLTIERILFLLVIIVLGLGLFSDRVDLRKNKAIELAMFLFVIICIVSMLQHGFVSPFPERFPSPWYVFINGYLFPFLVFVYAKYFLAAEKDQRAIFHVLFFFGFYLTIIAYFEFFGLRQFVYPRYINDPDVWLHLDRARGPFLNSAINGIAITIGFVCGLHLMQQKSPVSKIFYMGALMLFLPAIFFTQTRSVYLGFIIAFGGLLMLYRTDFPKWKVFALPVALVLVLVLTQGQRLFSPERKAGGVLQVREISIRFQLIQRSLGMIRENPLFGVGLAQFLPYSFSEFRGQGAVAESSGDTTQHNHLLGLLVEIGLVGIFAYLLIYILIFRRFFLLVRKIPEKGFIGVNFLLVGAIVWAIYINNNMFLEPSFFLFLNAIPFLFGGMVDGLYNKHVLNGNLV